MRAPLITGGLVLLLVASASAQLPALDPLPPPPMLPASKVGEDPEDEAEFDALIARSRLPRHRWVEVSSDTLAFHTSNVLLLPDLNRFVRPMEDAVVLQGFNLALTPPARHGLTVRAFLRHQIVLYNEHDELDFHSQSAGLRLNYPVLDWFTIYSGFSAHRQYLDSNDREFFKMYDTQIGLWRAQPICPWAALVAGYQLDWRASSPSELDRLDNAFYTGFTMSPCRNVAVNLLYRISVQEYLNNARSDLNHLFTAAFTYTINEYVRLHGFLNYGRNDSNIDIRDYDVFDAGGGLNLSVRF